MKLTILGTGNAMVTECYNTCFALSTDANAAGERQHFLVDTGGGNRILKVLKDTNISVDDIHMNQGKYDGELRIYCHSDLVDTIQTLSKLTTIKKVTNHLDERIRFIPLEHGDSAEILNCPITFFDIFSTKAKQYGFTMTLPGNIKFTCAGDEPYNEKDYEFVKGSDWLMHEAFCLYGEADIFEPYEKHHSTVREACQLAEELEIPNLILYHTEETHLADRKELYTAEGLAYYHGNLYVPNDLDTFEI